MLHVWIAIYLVLVENWMKYFGNQMKSMMCNSLVSLVYGNSYNTTLPLIIRYLLGYCDLIKEWTIYNEARISINQFEANIPYLFGSVFPHGNCKKKNVWLFGHSLMQHCYLLKKKTHINIWHRMRIIVMKIVIFLKKKSLS